MGLGADGSQEAQIWRLAAEGATNQEMSAISRSTVDNYLRKGLRKDEGEVPPPTQTARLPVKAHTTLAAPEH